MTFDEENRLVSIETDVSRMDSLQGIEFFSGILIPGMVNAHCHLELSYLKGHIPPGTGLDGFVESISGLRHGTSLEDRIRAADVQDSVMYQEGVLAVGDVCNDPFTFPLKQESRIHYHNFVEVYGSDSGRCGEFLSRGLDVVEKSRSAGLAYSLTPHSTYSLSEPLFESVIRENTQGGVLSIHFMESLSEGLLFRNAGPLAEQYRRAGVNVDFTRFGSPAGRLVAAVPGDIPLVLIHNTFVTEEDIDLIHSHFEKVTWVVCPRSNEFIEGAFPPVELLRRKGARIAVGTDSLSSNTSLSLLEEAKFLSSRLPGVSLEELVAWLCRNGAEALQVGDRLGCFEVGTVPGAVLIQQVDWDRMVLTPESEARR